MQQRLLITMTNDANPQTARHQALEQLAAELPGWARTLGFQQVGIADTKLGVHSQHLDTWLQAGRHGSMEYMARHVRLRAHPAELQPDTLRVISARMDYLTPAKTPLDDSDRAYVSRYALGRDYHKVLRSRLKRLLARIEQWVDAHNLTYAGSRLFTDSAPVLEKALAEKAGLGWIGKHTLLINQSAGSWFFLGEILTSLELPVTPSAQTNRCGSCQACMDICPTDAIVGPYELDARKCIAYLTIEHKGAIPESLRQPMGNRIFGCDDCQAVCPWNRYAAYTGESDFTPRANLDAATLLELFAWSEQDFDTRSAGSAIRRAGYEGWLRNIAVALGNAPPDREIERALQEKRSQASELVDEHIVWALAEQHRKLSSLARHDDQQNHDQ